MNEQDLKPGDAIIYTPDNPVRTRVEHHGMVTGPITGSGRIRIMYVNKEDRRIDSWVSVRRIRRAQ